MSNVDKAEMRKQEIARRLKAARKNSGYTQAYVAQMLGITYQAISNYERGVSRVDSETLVKLCSIYNVPVATILGAFSEDEGTRSYNSSIVSIRYLGSVAAGYGHLACEEYEFLDIPESWLNGRPASDFFAMRVSGSSMYPLFCDGDEILCQSCSSLEYSGEIGVIIYNEEEATLKKIEFPANQNWIRLVPVNPEYEAKTISKNDLTSCHIIGKPTRLIRNLE